MEHVQAAPTKRFFVSMLTRDIDLRDAILDLLDNCVDGILRLLSEKVTDKDHVSYDGFWAKITASPDYFSLEDNCGGIPRDVAINSAFRLGRIDSERDEDIPTVGMYGIGMKRALFKIGRHATVKSQHKDDTYIVDIPPTWLNNDENWTLELTDIDDRINEDGTNIMVRELYDAISSQFDENQTNFLNDLRRDIKRLYAIILKKGFKVYLNNEEIEPENLAILFSPHFNENSVQPYAYRGTHDGVVVDLVVGFYRELASELEIDSELLIPRKADNAGWTIICNDRVVLYRDKTYLTGWGLGDVPRYHPQFISIAGVVRFSSNESLKLPLNTTKRGIDTSSTVYWEALKFMMDGMKKFTDYTNSWKGREDETAPNFRLTVPTDATTILSSIPASEWRKVRGEDGVHYSPSLPRPLKQDTKRRISYLRPSEEVELVGRYFFDNPNAEPKEIGDRSFQDALDEARERLFK